MEWDQATKHFSSKELCSAFVSNSERPDVTPNYAKLCSYYSFLAENALDQDAKYYYGWMSARAIRLGGASYQQYAIAYILVFEKHVDRAEVLYELAQYTTDRTLRCRLYRECIYIPLPPPDGSKKWVDQDIYKWQALDKYVIDSFALGTTKGRHEAYDAWVLLKNRNLSAEVKELWGCHQYGISARQLLFVECDSYKIFLRELNSAPDLIITGRVPNVVHIIWVKGHRTYSIIQYLTVRAAAEVQRPTKIYIYNDVEPVRNIWWIRTKEIGCVEIVHVTPPRYVNGNHIPFAQHVADLMRIRILYVRGGVYLDADLLLTKPLKDVVNPENATLCQETDLKIWNGFMATPPGNPFYERWIREYETKYGQIEGGCWWAGLSVETPMRLYRENPAGVSLVETNTFLPFGIHDNTIYGPWQEGLYASSYGIHLWETEAEKRGVLPKDEQYFDRNPNTVFTKFFSKYRPT